jgi:hypothetical protein
MKNTAAEARLIQTVRFISVAPPFHITAPEDIVDRRPP